jgi:hypothetical protein
MERIARETEEDYQKLITLLESFGVNILRPTVSDNYNDYLIDGRILPPPMTPRDYSAMIGETFYFTYQANAKSRWDEVKGAEWPNDPPRSLEEYNKLPNSIKEEMARFNIPTSYVATDDWWMNILKEIESTNKVIYGTNTNAAMTTRVGRDLYFGTYNTNEDIPNSYRRYSKMFPDYRCHMVNTSGHTDGTFCPVKPGLIVSLYDIPTYKDTFPDWEVVYLPGQSGLKVHSFLNLKQKNHGKWWVPGEELNDDFTDFVESWLSHWVGYVEETVFDVNMLVIDEKNVVCNNYNKDVFDAFERHGITPHVINFRHRYFWDGGLHCITSDVHREGSMKDYFPKRG